MPTTGSSGGTILTASESQDALDAQDAQEVLAEKVWRRKVKERKDYLADIIAGRSERNRRLLKGPVKLIVATAQTGEGLYTRTIWRAGIDEPIAVQAVRKSEEFPDLKAGIKTGTETVMGDAARTILRQIASFDD